VLDGIDYLPVGSTSEHIREGLSVVESLDDVLLDPEERKKGISENSQFLRYLTHLTLPSLTSLGIVFSNSSRGWEKTMNPCQRLAGKEEEEGKVSFAKSKRFTVRSSLAIELCVTVTLDTSSPSARSIED